MNVEQWYIENYKNKSGERFETFKLALTLLYEQNPTPLIVETGTVRMENDYGAGYSTYIFGQCTTLFGGRVITVDNVLKHMDISKKLTEEFSKKITYVLDDSLKFLADFNEKIDLLYLDSFDCPITGDATEAQEHNLNEFLISESKLTEKSLILIDDIGFENGGKAKLTHAYLEKNNYRLIKKHQQSLWSK